MKESSSQKLVGRFKNNLEQIVFCSSKFDLLNKHGQQGWGQFSLCITTWVKVFRINPEFRILRLISGF